MQPAHRKYNEKFLEEYQQLNENQRKAVDQIEGPVLVIAGPGTGKTQILASRIGKILLDTDADAHTVLCLTYTDAGAVNMRKRLFEFIGPEAYRVNIYTFHAFCNEIIQEHPDKFGKMELDAISDLERVELFRRLVDSFGADHPLKRFRGNAYFETARLENLFSVMKKEDWQPEFISEKIDAYIALIKDSEPGTPYYKEFKYAKKYRNNEAGDLKPSFQTLCERLEQLRAAAGEFPKYRQMMRDMSRYDFEDMILWVLDAFKKDELFLLQYQERYQYLLVDEYQDTSGAQNELVKLLVSYWDRPNIFVVGDDDQSIFRFQGANVENIEAFRTRYADDLYKVMLTENYRSTQPILDTARLLIEHNTERIRLPGLSKHLLSKTAVSPAPAPEIRSYPTAFHELAAVTDEVYRLTGQGVPGKEIAVIYREHRTGEELARYFQLKGIPVNTKRKVNILKEPFGKKLVNLLRYLSLEMEFPGSGDERLFEILHYDFYEIAPMDTARISIEVNRHNRTHADKISIRGKIHDIALKTGQTLFDTESRQQIKRLSDDLEYWLKEAHNITLQSLFEKIVVRGGILAYVLGSPDKTWLMQVLTSLFDFLKEESRRDPGMDLKTFVYRVDLLEENDLPLELQQHIFNQEGVNFLTCHGSKGLEFRYVFLIGCTGNTWEKKRPNNQRQYKLPDTVFLSQSATSDEEELRRLFYVAVTRAKQYLYISYPERDNRDKLLEPTRFIGEILAEPGHSLLKPEVAEETLTDFFTLQFTEEQRPQIGLIDTEYVQHLLESYILSVTHLNNYLECPLKFYFQNLVMVPSGKSDPLTFGSAVHYALNRLFSRGHPGSDNKQFHGPEQLVADFHWYMKRNREAFTPEQFKRRTEYGALILPAWYHKYAGTWEKVTLTEYHIRNVEIDGVPVKGTLDKLEFKGKEVNVVDYKTGSYLRAKDKFRRPGEKNPDGGDYWRQAVFYKLLVDHDRSKDWQAVSAEFDFIEPEKEEYIKEKLLISPEDEQMVRDQIKDAYTRIMNLEFTKGCGKPDCHWCNFVRSNFKQVPEELNDLEI